MGNSHGHHHRKNRYDGSSSSNTETPQYKFGPSDQNSPQMTSSTYPQPIMSLPYAHVDSSLRALAGQAEGFGRFAVGGLHGSVYYVTTLAGNFAYM